MIGLTRIQTLEKQNKDLRTRLDNRQGKAELALHAKEDEAMALKAQLRAKDKAIKDEVKAWKVRLCEKDDTIAMLQAGYAPLVAENDHLRQQIEILKSEISALRATLEKAEDRAAKLAAMLKKDSSTSDKPPSTDNPFVKAKAASQKKKSGKKPGGQPGHKGHRLLPSDNPDVIIEKSPPNRCPHCGGDVILCGEYEPRQIVDVKVTVTVTEERSLHGKCCSCGETLHGEFSVGFNSVIGYGPNIKAMAAVLNTDANVSVNKTAGFLSCLTEGRINMSDGTVVNIITELARKFDPAVRDIVDALATCGVLNVDETGCRVSGDLAWIQIISNDSFSLFGRSPKRGTLSEMMDNLILLFVGVLVHDHLKSYYRYTHLTHAECNTHGLRYLNAVTEIMQHPWAKAMADLLTGANKRKKELIEAGFIGMPEEELAGIRENYINILKQGRSEYQSATAGKKNISYFVEERRLLNRLAEYIDEHLRFLADFSVPFSNNGAERGAKHLKRKQKVSGGFRSYSGVDNYGVVASVMATLRKKHMHVFTAIRNTFQGICLRFDNSKGFDSG